jgi:CheY-like chemotaxis protein
MPQQPSLPLQSNQRAPRQVTGDARLTGLHVLVVDDDRQIRTLVSAAFVRAGATVIATDSAAMALAAMDECRAGLIVSDIEMPVEDGYSLMRRLRSRGAASGGNIPAIALSGSASADARDNALAAGFSVYMSKPFSSLDLVRTAAALTLR